MDERTVSAEADQRRAFADVTATLCHEQCPTPRTQMATALLDYGQGKVRVVARDREEIERLTAVPQDSLVRATGLLVHHSSRSAGGRYREYYELRVESLEILHDARVERMRP